MSQLLKILRASCSPPLLLRFNRICLCGLSNNFSISGFSISTKAMESSPASTPPAKSSSTSPQLQQKLLVNNIHINYQKVGNGPTPLICLPGALGFIEADFGPILTKFNLSQFTLVVWDPPGYGKSRPPDRDFSRGALHMFQTDAHISHSLMQALGFTKFCSIGWSDGGITALIQAIRFPNSIDKMVVFGANAFINQQDINLYMKIRDIDSWSPRMKAPMIEMYGEKYFRKTWSQWVDACIKQFATTGGDLCKEDIKNIKCPTFIIHGLKDPMVGLDHAEYLQHNIKNSKLHVMPEGKHNLHLRFPNEFIREVEGFLLSKENESNSN